MDASSTSSFLLHSSILLPRSPHRSRRATKVFAMKRDWYDREFRRGRTVDENMIVLRKRIHEMKMIERNYEAPLHWMEWEKKYYTVYDSSVCNVVGVLQQQLMKMRPSSAFGLAALVAFSVPTCTVMVLLHLMDVLQQLN